MKRILCALLLICVLAALTPAALADGQVQKVSLSIPCIVTVDVGEHGKVYSNGTTWTGPTVGSFQVWPGTRVSFLITPDTGYVVDVLTLSGADVRAGLRYGLYSTIVEHNETLVVRFEKSVTPTPTPTPTTSPSPTPTTSPTPTPTTSPTPTPTTSPTPTPTTSPTPTPTTSPTPTPTTSPTPTPTTSPSPTPAPSTSPTPSPSPWIKPTPRPTVTPYPWITPTPTTPPWQVTPPYGPKTGDESAVSTWSALLLVSAAALIVLSRKSKKP